jgi:hypothetical protein
MKAYRGVDAQRHAFLEVSGQLQDPRAGLEDMEKLKFLTLRVLKF